MIIVKVELHSAITGTVSELGRAQICNTGGGTAKRGNYLAEVLRKNSKEVLRVGRVDDYPRLSYNMWRLVIRALLSCFPEERK